MRAWEWAFLISMVITAAPVARNRVVLPELEKGLLLLGFFVCDLTFDGFLCYLQRLHGSCRQPLPKRVRGPSISHVADFKKKTENSNQTGKASAHVVCNAQTLSAAHSLPNMSARHSAAHVEADVLCLLNHARVMSRCEVSALQSSFRHRNGALWHAHAACLPQSCFHAAV